MTRRIDWSDEAGRDFQEAMDYIAVDSETAAELVASRILTAIDALGEFPTGHPGRVKGTYEKLVQKTQYIVAYTMSDRSIFVVRIIHGARDWPAGEWPAE